MGAIMFSRPDLRNRLHDLQHALRRAQVVTPDLMLNVVAGACTRRSLPGCAAKAAVIDRLIESEAWTEAALALVELELPQWKMRRLLYEAGGWLCSLSKQWNVPAWLDDGAEARHECMSIAILSALIEAQQRGEPSPRLVASSVPQCRGESAARVETLCCENFA
jgi:hypothetical protein